MNFFISYYIRSLDDFFERYVHIENLDVMVMVFQVSTLYKFRRTRVWTQTSKLISAQMMDLLQNSGLRST